MSAILSASDLVAEIGLVADRLEANSDVLCRLDGLIGDGDHGVAMAEGFRSAANAASALDAGSATLADVFGAAAKAFLNTVGASSGPLYATALMRAGKAAGARRAMPIEETPVLIVAMADGVRARGQASIGDKTMMDAWGPSAKVAEKGVAENLPLALVIDEIRKVAQAGANATKQMIALKGRAARLGERSLGHVDPGAASAAIIIDALAGDWLARLGS